MMDAVEWLTSPKLEDGSERRRLPPELGYQDYVLLVTASELRDWHQKDRHRAFEGSYGTPPWQKVIGPKIAELERLLAAPDCPRFFLAHWYEWESGL
jgi:hypothetical protein